VSSHALLRCVGCPASFSTLQALCAHLISPATPCTITRSIHCNCLVVAAVRHFLAPCTFCTRYFRSSGRRKHHYSCSHNNNTPSHPPPCGASLPRGRPAPVPPSPWPPPFMGPFMGGTPKPSSSPISFPSNLVRRRTASSSKSLLVAFYLSMVGPHKEHHGAAWAALLLFPRLVLRPMAYFTCSGHLPLGPVVDYRNSRFAHWALEGLDTLLSASRAHAPSVLGGHCHFPHFQGTAPTCQS
jgi:hypothetical protein